MHAKGPGAFGAFAVANDITQYMRASNFRAIGMKTEMFGRFATADRRDPRTDLLTFRQPQMCTPPWRSARRPTTGRSGPP